MKKLVFILLIFCAIAVNAQKSLQSNGLSLSVDPNGKMVSILGDKEYLPDGMSADLIQLIIGGEIYQAHELTWEGNIATLSFEKGIAVSVSCEPEELYLKFEITEVENENQIDAIIWGPFPTTIDKTIGEIVGVVRNGTYAIGFQSLNSKTTGGQLKNSDGSDGARGTTATKEEHGSSLQGYCINRNKKRIYNIWNERIPNAVVNFNSDGKLAGSAIALFGTQEPSVLDVIENIELQEGLPHATINGEWVKRSKEANKPYLISRFSEETIDECLEYCEKLGYNTLYHPHPFKNWGHFELLENQFPNGWDGMKICVEKAKVKGIRLGVHTLTNFITTNDPYVTPLPHEDLMTFCETTITRDLPAESTDIYLDDITGYEVKNTCQALRIDNEIIQFNSVSKESPYKLTDCKRGAYGTTISSHQAGSKIARLADHAYKTLFPNFQLQKEMITRLATFFNYTGVGQLDFDGHEGGWGTGEGEFGMDYFSDAFISQVNHEVRNGSSRSNHYYWHVNSYINWGEPWYGGFTKSQGHYRYQNQALLKRNYIPNMLGWFLLNTRTTIQEFEYMLARSAGYDAGYALTGSIRDFKRNEEFNRIAEAVRIWEEARLKRIFNEEQIEVLKNVQNDFSLRKVDGATFELQYFHKEKFELLNELVQPGQPNDVNVDLNCKESQDLYLVIGAVGESGTINKVNVEINAIEAYSVLTDLQPNYAITYRGDNKVLIYDEKGRLKKIEELTVDGIKLSDDANNLRISAEFSDGAELKLEGYVRVKEKVEIIKSE